MRLPYQDYMQAKDFTCLGTWCLLFGPEQHRKREALARMRAEVTLPGEEPTWETLDGPSVTAGDLLNRCQTGALFGGPRVIVVSAADRILAEEQEKLATAVGPLPAGVSLILVTSESGDRRRPGALHAKLQRALEQAGLAIEFPSLKASEAAAWAVKQAKERGKRLEPSAARKLAEQRVGTGLAELESEIEKLSLFVGDATAITGADVDAVTPRLVAEDIWGLVAAVGQRNPARAVAILRGLLRDRRESPKLILGLLAQSLRLIWQTKLLLDRGWRPGQQPDEETAGLLPQDPRKNALAQFARRPWLARRTVTQQAAFTWEQLARAIRALLACDVALKGMRGAVSDAAALELLVIQLCADLELPVWQAAAEDEGSG